MSDSEGTDSPPTCGAYFRLRRRHQKFVDVYVETGNGSEAIRRVSPKSKRPDCAASKLLAKPEIRAAVQERTDQDIFESGVRRNLLLKKLLKMVDLDVRDLYGADGALLSVRDLPDNVATSIAGVEVLDTRTGPVRKYLLESRLRAITELLRYATVKERRDTDADGERLMDEPIGKIVVEVVDARTAHPDDPATG
ncbi:MAG: Phage terminase, small subunit [Gammaproteobacteria bacterium]|jgi:hypothetical protein|nr:Phage terminase, small subunit [Gammaproteobacteria bacterium]